MLRAADFRLNYVYEILKIAPNFLSPEDQQDQFKEWSSDKDCGKHESFGVDDPKSV